MLDKRKTIKPKVEILELIRTADLKKTFSKSVTTNWFDKLYEITEFAIDTRPSYKIDQIPERYNEALLKKTIITMKENDSVMKKVYVTKSSYSVMKKVYVTKSNCL